MDTKLFLFCFLDRVLFLEDGFWTWTKALGQQKLSEKQWKKWSLISACLLLLWRLSLCRYSGSHREWTAYKSERKWKKWAIFLCAVTSLLTSVFCIQEYLTLLLGGYLLWPAAQLVNFYYVPLKFRVNYANLISLIWNSFVGYVANRPVHKQSGHAGTTC